MTAADQLDAIVARLMTDINEQLRSSFVAVLEPPEEFSTLQRAHIIRALDEEFGIRVFARHAYGDKQDRLHIRILSQQAGRPDLFVKQNAIEEAQRISSKSGGWQAAGADFFKRRNATEPRTPVFGLLPVQTVLEHNEALQTLERSDGPPVFFGRSPRRLPSALIVLATNE